MTLDAFFQGYESSRPIFDALRAVLDTIGPTELRVSKSQITFWRRRSVARVWIPARYLRGNPAPLVLTLAFRQPIPSPRWKQIAHPTPAWTIHHLELSTAAEIDAEVTCWLRLAWEQAA